MMSALTPEKVPTPPAAAQAPQDRPSLTATPLPPSTKGQTSAPDITRGCTMLISTTLLRRGGSSPGWRTPESATGSAVALLPDVCGLLFGRLATPALAAGAAARLPAA